MRLQLASAATSMSVCDFAAARAVLQPLSDELDDIAARIGLAAQREWKRRAPSRGRWRSRPRCSQPRRSSPGSAWSMVSALAAELQQLIAQGSGKACTPRPRPSTWSTMPKAGRTPCSGREQARLLFQGKAAGPVQAGADGAPPRR